MQLFSFLCCRYYGNSKCIFLLFIYIFFHSFSHTFMSVMSVWIFHLSISPSLLIKLIINIIKIANKSFIVSSTHDNRLLCREQRPVLPLPGQAATFLNNPLWSPVLLAVHPGVLANQPTVSSVQASCKTLTDCCSAQLWLNVHTDEDVLSLLCF